MIEFILTIVQDTNKDEEVIADLEQYIDGHFDEFVDGVMQNYKDTEYGSHVEWGYGDSEGKDE